MNYFPVLEKIQFHELNTVPAKTVLSSVKLYLLEDLNLGVRTVTSACTMKVKLYAIQNNTEVLSNVTFVFHPDVFHQVY